MKSAACPAAIARNGVYVCPEPLTSSISSKPYCQVLNGPALDATFWTEAVLWEGHPWCRKYSGCPGKGTAQEDDPGWQEFRPGHYQGAHPAQDRRGLDRLPGGCGPARVGVYGVPHQAAICRGGTGGGAAIPQPGQPIPERWTTRWKPTLWPWPAVRLRRVMIT